MMSQEKKKKQPVIQAGNTQPPDKKPPANTTTPPKKSGHCFSGRMTAARPEGDLPLAQRDWLGQRVWSWHVGEVGYPTSQAHRYTQKDRGLHRVIWFMQEDEQGQSVEFGLLRSVLWMHENSLHQVGDFADIDHPEMGVSGPAQVLRIDACPELEEGAGCLVTGWYRHSHGEIWEVVLEGGETIETTAQHPFWSADRLAFVPACELQKNEHLSGREGLVKVLSIRKRPGFEPVYNIEVEGDHCYRVGQQGLLVHNASYNFSQIEDPTNPFYDNENLHHDFAMGAAIFRGAGAPPGLKTGSSNLGAIYFLNDGKLTRFPSISGQFVVGIAGNHSEMKIAAELQRLTSNCSTKLQIQQLFTERYPCQNCQDKNIAIIAACSCSTFTIYWIAPHSATESGPALIAEYIKIGIKPWPK